jgi:tRNA threonylcarbamoyladenosine biosynthesis protein TsaB
MRSRVLVIDSALGVCAAGVFDAGNPVAAASEALRQGHAARLPALVAEVLASASGPQPDLIAVTIGPGSFTGLRGAIALAHGLAAGWEIPLVGVGVAEAYAADAASTLPIWVAIHSRPGRIFLAHHGQIASHAIADLPPPPTPCLLTGNAAVALAAAWGQSAHGLRLHPSPAPSLAAIAAIAARRHLGELPPLPAQPLYIDAPEAKPLAPP